MTGKYWWRVFVSDQIY